MAGCELWKENSNMETADMPPPERNPEGTTALRTSWQSKAGLITVCVLLVAATLGLDLVLPWGAAMSMLYIAGVLVSLWSLSGQFTVLATIVCSLLTILGFFYSPSGGILWMALVNRALVLGMLWGLALFSFPRRVPASRCEPTIGTRAETQATGKSLRGFLPICASCKNVRDDRGSWHQIEVYVSEHSEAQFTHSICPDCIRRLYPEHCETGSPCDPILSGCWSTTLDWTKD